VNLPANDFCNASGLNPNNGAKIVFVWHYRGPCDYVPLGSGHVVDAVGRPPGIRVGQYSVTFPLPPGCSADEIVVTDDTGVAHLLSAIVRPCSAVLEFKLGGKDSAGDRAARIVATNAPPKIQRSSDCAQSELES
jgi:hypothetical protein